jgi:hypothetical protein
MGLPRALLGLSIAAISLVAQPHLARAQSAEAEALFSEGDAKLKAGQIGEACDAFEASNRLEARAGTLIRLGECREKNKQLASAWSAYKDALTRVKDPKKKAIATAKVAELEPKLSYLTLSVPDTSKREGLAITRNGQPFDSVLWNRAIPINGGDYAISATAPGRSEWKTTVTVPVEKGKVTVTVPALDEAGKVTPAPTPLPTAAPTPQPAPTPIAQPAPIDEGPTTSRWTGKRKIALVLAGVSAAGFVGGAVLGSRAAGLKNDAYALCPDPGVPCADATNANELLTSARSKARTANIAFGVGAATAIGAAVLWFIGAPESSSNVAVVPINGGTALAVGGSF